MAHRALDPSAEEIELRLGNQPWRPAGRAVELGRRLASTLDHKHIVELVLFGSQARGGTTGFSDVDAILVITDEAAEDVAVLSSLRPRVLTAQRAVLSLQPMQHHGFEVVTARLLTAAGDALALPHTALIDSRSLHGRSVLARFRQTDGLGDPSALREIAANVLAARSWPTHPWHLHRLVSMFELLPTLYLQARGERVQKANSFGQARSGFGDAWWPYDVLLEVRSRWPAARNRPLDVAAAAIRNPWLAVKLWARLPVKPPESASTLLSDDCLRALQDLGRAMLEEIS